MKAVLTIISMLGSVGLFLYAMKLLSSSLQSAAGGGLEKILSAVTRNRFTGVLTGVVSTALVQSSTATTVMVVGLVNAGIFTLEQSISVIMGANIGTTVTAWIVSIFGFSIDITLIAFGLLILATILNFTKNIKAREIAKIVTGISLIFIALHFLKSTAPSPADGNEGVLGFLSKFNNHHPSSVLICALVGILMSFVLQSSAAAMTLTITLASLGWIGVYTASVLCLGQNIGTTITAMIASSSGTANAKRAALVHFLFNFVGSVLAIIFLRPLLAVVNALTASNIFTLDPVRLEHDLPVFLAMFHTVFNLINTLLFLPFVKYIAKLVGFIIPSKRDKESEYDKPYKFNFRHSLPFLSIPDVYLTVIRDEIVDLSTLAKKMVNSISLLLNDKTEDSEDLNASIKNQEQYADQMQEELTAFCVNLMGKGISKRHTATLSSYIRIIDELESITDSIFTLSKDIDKQKQNSLQVTAESRAKIVSYLQKSIEYLDYIHTNIQAKPTQGVLKTSFQYENALNIGRAELVKHVEEKMEKSDDVRVELVEFDMIRHIEHIGDYCTNIAQALAKIS